MEVWVNPSINIDRKSFSFNREDGSDFIKFTFPSRPNWISVILEDPKITTIIVESTQKQLPSSQKEDKLILLFIFDDGVEAKTTINYSGGFSKSIREYNLSKILG